MEKFLMKKVSLVMLLIISLGAKNIFADDSFELKVAVKIKVEGKLIEGEQKIGDSTKPYYFLMTKKGEKVSVGAKDDINLIKIKAKEYLDKSVLVSGLGNLDGEFSVGENGKVTNRIPLFAEVYKIELIEKVSEVKKK